MKRMKLDPYHTQKLAQNGKDLHVRPEAVQHLEENIWEKLLDIGLGNDFFDLTLNHWQQKQKSTSGEGLRGSLQQKKPSANQKGSLWNGRKYLQSIYLITIGYCVYVYVVILCICIYFLYIESYII